MGPVDAWPRSLLTTVQTILHSRHPMFLWWGPELIQREAGARPRGDRTQRRRTARLISDLLDVSRIISGKLRLTLQRVEVGAAIHAALDVVRQAADAKGVRLVAELAPETGALVADPDRLQQIVWNLLSNAVKFTPSGGVVRVTAQRVASRVRLCVIDSGAGIARDDLPVIFERFRQVDGSTTRAHGPALTPGQRAVATATGAATGAGRREKVIALSVTRPNRVDRKSSR